MRDKTSRKSERDVVGSGVGLVIGSGWSFGGIRPVVVKLVGATVENLRRLGHQILKNRKEPFCKDSSALIGSGGWIRTSDQLINSQLRYHCATPELSQLGDSISKTVRP